MSFGWFVLISFALHLGAAYQAFALGRFTSRQWAWYAVAVSIVLQLGRRAIILSGWLFTGRVLAEPSHEITVAIASLIMLLGLWKLRDHFQENQRNREHVQAIEAKKRAEGELFNSRQMLQLVLDHIPQRVFWKDRNSVYLGCNLPMARDCGFSDPAELVGKDDSATASGAMAERFRADDREVMETGEPKIHYQEAQLKKDGTQGWLLANKVPLRDTEGHIIGVLGTYEEITERKQMEEALRSSEEKLRMVLDGVMDPIFSIDAEGRYLFVNLAFAKPFGKTPDEVIGMTLWDLFPKEQADHRYATVQKVVASDEPVTFEVQVQTVGQDLTCYLTTVSPRHDAEGKVMGVFCISKEITEHKRAEEALRQAEKSENLGLMAGHIAHDFNNHFQAIQGYLEVARANSHSPSKIQATLDRVQKTLEKATHLSQGMLDYSGKSLRKSVPVDLAKMVRQHAENLVRKHPEDQKRNPQNKIRIQLEIASNLPDAQGDPEQLMQVFTCLVNNAVEAMGDVGGHLRIGLEMLVLGDSERAQGGWIEPPPAGEVLNLTVTDDGHGIDVSRMERIFDPFYTTKPSSRGLGLAASRGILRGHRAGVQVLSAPGKGTTVRVCLSPATQSASDAAEQEDTDHGKARAILLVDDDPDLRESLGEILHDILGFPVLKAQDGVEAVEQFRKEGRSIALILMDATMPRMTGAEAFRAIKALDPNVRAILVSGYSEDAGRETARQQGFLSFLKKPFTIQALKETIEKAMG